VSFLKASHLNSLCFQTSMVQLNLQLINYIKYHISNIGIYMEHYWAAIKIQFELRKQGKILV
jgi:hypothetical protein